MGPNSVCRLLTSIFSPSFSQRPRRGLHKPQFLSYSPAEHVREITGPVAGSPTCQLEYPLTAPAAMLIGRQGLAREGCGRLTVECVKKVRDQVRSRYSVAWQATGVRQGDSIHGE